VGVCWKEDVVFTPATTLDNVAAELSRVGIRSRPRVAPQEPLPLMFALKDANAPPLRIFWDELQRRVDVRSLSGDVLEAWAAVDSALSPCMQASRDVVP